MQRGAVDEYVSFSAGPWQSAGRPMEIGAESAFQEFREVARVLCYLNGEFFDRGVASIPVEDRGFIFGDGVYEVWRVLNGRLFELQRHLDRLNFGLDELRIARPAITASDALTEVADQILSENDLLDGEATFYLEITRGVASRGHAFPSVPTAPSVFAMANRFLPAHELRARGAKAITMTDVRWLRCDLKTIQLLPNVLAKQAAAERGATEALLIRDRSLTEGSHTNVFVVVDGVLRTHPLTNLVLAGITRALVIDLARSLGLSVEERAVSDDELALADEVFLTGTTTDIMPIIRVNDRPIGTGAPGEITMRLYRELLAFMEEPIAADRGVSSRSS